MRCSQDLDALALHREACAEAQHSFDEAVEIDPRYAPAHAWLARTYVWQSCMNWVPFAIEPALEHARRAVEIDSARCWAIQF